MIVTTGFVIHREGYEVYFLSALRAFVVNKNAQLWGVFYLHNILPR